MSIDPSETDAAIVAVDAAPNEEALEALRVAMLGRQGRFRAWESEIPKLPPDERKAYAATLNQAKQTLEAAIKLRREALAKIALEARLAAETLDPTLPTRPERLGRIHPISHTIDEVVAIFGEMGFRAVEGPDIEDDFHNFTALNFPPGHPAREMHDTFYLPDRPGQDGQNGQDGQDPSRMVLRTHTSPVQVRTMLTTEPPIRVIVPGRTFRSDSDQTHTPMFHQIEGLVIDEHTHMGHLKGCIAEFVQAYFEIADLRVRFRPSFFPFTEPSAEVDIGCSRAGGELKIGTGDDWLEILGCGMVHPTVLRNCGIDPERYQGFAFGVGLERIAMLKYGIPDLRTFFDADLRWLNHYGFAPLDIPSLVMGALR